MVGSVPWPKSPGLVWLLNLVIVAGSVVERLVKEAVKVGEGVERLVEESGKRHLVR